MSALRQLTRRTRVNLIYDPSLNTLTGTHKKDSGSHLDLLLPKKDMAQIVKTSSHHPAFLTLADTPMIGANDRLVRSKVFLKRNLLYQELKSVLISVEQCASLWLLEDFLRSRIKTVEDVKGLKAPPNFYNQMKSSTTNKHARTIMEKALDKMRELLEKPQDRMRTESEDLSNLLAEEIVNSKDLNDQDQQEIIRQLEIQSL